MLTTSIADLGATALFFDAAPDAIVAVDAEGLIRFANRRAVALFGSPQDELIGRSLDEFETEDGVLVLAALRDVTNRKRIEGERGELAGGVAHDFNNLLSAIMNYAGLVSERLEDQMNRLGLSENKAFVTLTQDVEEITKVAKQAAALTDQL